VEARPATRIKLEVAQGSDPGRDPNKQVNEDSSGYAECRFGHLLVLCDGMGGHYGGREASRTAIATIFEVVDRMPVETLPAIALKSAVEEAGRRVYALGGPPENRMRPGSTVVAVLVHDKGADVAHVGDSRAYVIRSGAIYPLTRDHSMVQGMIDAGMLTEEQAIGHPDLNKITRALGMRQEVEVEIRPEPMEVFPGDLFMTTRDGLTDVALGRDILGSTRQSLSSGNLDYAVQMLIKMANDRGGPDNVTVQIARVTDVAPKHTIPEGPFSARAQQAAQQQAPQQQAQAQSMRGNALQLPPQQQPQSIHQTGTGGHPGAMTMQMGGAPPQAGTPAPPGASPYPLPPGVRPNAQPTQPTVNEGTPGSVRPTVTEGQRLGGFRASNPNALPLPPQQQQRVSRPPGPYPSQAPYGGNAAYAEPLAGPQKNSAVFIIFGLASAVAVLLIVVLWLLLRS
jgi:PPM family protein phosphatase